MGKITAAITGVGEYLPDYILTNEELSTMVDTSDEWIMSHIGVKTRHILKGEGVGSSYMGARAVINLLDKAGVDPMEIDLVICATVTPDMFFPSTGNLIADQAGCKNAFAYDVSAACSGFLFALTEHGHANGLAQAMRQGDGATDHLVGIFGVNAQTNGHVHGFVKFGESGGQRLAHSVFNAESRLKVNPFKGVAKFFAMIGHGNNPCRLHLLPGPDCTGPAVQLIPTRAGR